MAGGEDLTLGVVDTDGRAPDLLQKVCCLPHPRHPLRHRWLGSHSSIWHHTHHPDIEMIASGPEMISPDPEIIFPGPEIISPGPAGPPPQARTPTLWGQAPHRLPD